MQIVFCYGYDKYRIIQKIYTFHRLEQACAHGRAVSIENIAGQVTVSVSSIEAVLLVTEISQVELAP